LQCIWSWIIYWVIFFLFHPFTLDFYIKSSLHSFNYDVFGLESLIELI
jgi:hypothetical protein